MVYRGAIEQAQVLAYIDDFWIIATSFMAVLPIPLAARAHRRRTSARGAGASAEPLPAPGE
jgi:hypothetical protein